MIAKVKKTISYPESDGKPMAETNVYVLSIISVHQALQAFFDMKRQEAWVASNIFWFWEVGDPKKRIAPDTMAILGATPDARSYYSWKHVAKRPDIIFEFTSKKTRKEDIDVKFHLYEQLGVPEYVMFDPIDSYLFPRLQVYSLIDGLYEIVKPVEGFWASSLGFKMKADGRDLRLYDAATGELMQSQRELTQRAKAQDLEIARLRGLLERKTPNGQTS